MVSSTLTFVSGLSYSGQNPQVCIKAATAGITLVDESTASAFSNATISSLTLDGSNGGAFYSGHDCVVLRGATSVSLAQVTTHHCSEDGVYVTGWGSPATSGGNGLTIDHLVTHDNGRNGMSIAAGSNITVTNSQFYNQTVSAPFTGADVEPTVSGQTVSGITFEHCQFHDNSYYGFQASDAMANMTVNLVLLNDFYFNNGREGAYIIGSGFTWSNVYLSGAMFGNSAPGGFYGGADVRGVSSLTINNLTVSGAAQALYLSGVSTATVATSKLAGSTFDINTNTSTGVTVYSSVTLADSTSSGSYTAASGTAPSITSPTTLPSALMGAAYSTTFKATGDATLTWSLASGSNLPAGVSLSSGGALTGTPSAMGKYSFQVKVTNGVSYDQRTFYLSVSTSSVLDDYGCVHGTLTPGSPTVVDCSTPHGFGTGWHAWDWMNFSSAPTAGCTVTLDTTTYTWVNSLTNSTPNQVLIDSNLSNSTYNFMAAVIGDPGFGTAYSATTPPNPTLDALWAFGTVLKVRSRAGGPSGAGLTTTTNCSGITFTMDSTGAGPAVTTASNSTQFVWYVQIGTVQGGPWMAINNPIETVLASDIPASGTAPFYVMDGSVLEANGVVQVCGSAGGPPENIGIGSITGNQVQITSRALPASSSNAFCSGNASSTPVYHSSGDYYQSYNNNPIQYNGGDVVVAGNLSTTVNRRKSWVATYRDANSFTIPLNSTGFGAYTANGGIVNIYRASESVAPSAGGYDFPLWSLQNNNHEIFSFTDSTSNNITIDDGSPAGCQSTAAAALVTCKMGYEQPFPGGTGWGTSQASFAASGSVTIGGGIGTIILDAAYDQTWGGPGGSSLAGNNLDGNLYPNRLIWITGFNDATLNGTYFLICDNTNAASCSANSVTYSGGTCTPTVSCKVTSFKFLALRRDGTLAPDGNYTISASNNCSVNGSCIQVVPHHTVRFFWAPHINGNQPEWANGMMYQVKSGVMPDQGNIHGEECVVEGGSQLRSLNGGYEGNSWAEFTQATGDSFIWKRGYDTGSNQQHYYLEPSPHNTYKGQKTCLTLPPVPFTHNNLNGGGELWNFDPTFQGNMAEAGWNPKSHFWPHMYNLYMSESEPNMCQSGSCTGGTYALGPLNLVPRDEPDELIQSLQCTYSPARVTDGQPGYECAARIPKYTTGNSVLVRSSTGDMRINGFSSGSDACLGQASGCSVAYLNNTSNTGILWNGIAGEAQAAAKYVAFRPVAGVGGCSGNGIAPIRCNLNNNIELMAAPGDHVTTSGITGNTAANMTNVALLDIQPRQYFWHNTPGTLATVGGTAFSNNGGQVQVKASGCCAASEPWAFHTGNTVEQITSSASFYGCSTQPCSMDGYAITVVDNDDFVINGSSYGTGGFTNGTWRLTGPPTTNGLTSIVSDGGSGTLANAACTATLSNDFPNVYAGNWLSVIGGAANLGSTTIQNYQITAVSHTGPYTAAFKCPNVAAGTYSTDWNNGYRLALVFWPTFVLPGAGNGNYPACGVNDVTACSGTVVTTDDTKGFSEIALTATVAGCSITATSCPNANTGVAYTCNITVSGCAAPAWSIGSGSLPGWAALNANTGAITGTPSGPTPTTTGFTINVTDANGNPTLATSIPDCTPPTITTTNPLPNAAAGANYSDTLTATGDAAITWSSSGLPPFLSLSSAGVLSGTPPSGGIFTFTVTAVNSCGSQGPLSVSLPVNLGPTSVTGVSTLQGNTAIH